MDISEVKKSLILAGIVPGDTLMVHGDAIIASQLTMGRGEKKLEALYTEILEYLGSSGTLVIPTFTYSFTKGEIYDVQKTPSSVGVFSEHFRLMFPLYRSKQPIFSVVAVGANQRVFQDSAIDDCFGINSCFDLLLKFDAKLMNLGCNLMLTFTHYVEQSVGVSYRYFKNFSGTVIDRSFSFEVDTKYYVGNQELRYALNLDRLKKYLEDRGTLRVAPFGRFGSYTVRAQDYFQDAKTLIQKDPYALIEEGMHA